MQIVFRKLCRPTNSLETLKLKKQEQKQILKYYTDSTRNTRSALTEREGEEIDLFEMSKSEFNVEKLIGSDNYHDWCFAIENLLALKGLKQCIVAKKVTGAEPEVAVETDAAKLEQAKSTLALSVEKNLFVHIRNCATALEIWKKFQNLFEDRGLQRKIHLLRTLQSRINWTTVIVCKVILME